MISASESAMYMLRAIVRSERGSELSDYIQGQADTLANLSLTADSAAMYRMQGAAIVLHELAATLRGAAKAK